jgi:Phage tail lysozyme
MSDDAPFDMPPKSASFDERGAWLVKRLADAYELTLTQAAGIVGNLGFESEGFAVLQERGQTPPRGGWGFAQWTGPRRRAFMRWCATHNLNPSSDEANVGYLETELDGSYNHALDELGETATLERAVFVFGRLYEAPAGTTPTHLPGFNCRLAYARRALTHLTGDKT